MGDRRHRVVRIHQARSALDEIVLYVTQESIQGARGVLDEVLGAAAARATLTERGRIVPDLEDPSIREVFVGNHRVLYEVAANGGAYSRDSARCSTLRETARRDLRSYERAAPPS